MHLYVGKRRKDGKIPVTLVYPNNTYGGSSLNKLVTPVQLEELKAEAVSVGVKTSTKRKW